MINKILQEYKSLSNDLKIIIIVFIGLFAIVALYLLGYAVGMILGYVSNNFH